MFDWTRIGGSLDFCAVYFMAQLVRCSVCSFALAGCVMLLRKMFFSERTFIRGTLWMLFLFLPLLGRLKLFYGNGPVGRMMWKLTAGTMPCLWAGRIYMAGMFVSGICIFRNYLRIHRMAANMEKAVFHHMQVCVTDMNITPFTAGLLRPQIILPRVMMDSCSRQELEVVVRHEQTHIRLGHLWFGFAWDLLRCMLWINPFLTMIQKYLRADMEDICDRVCIQNSKKPAYEYGAVLLKSIKLLRPGRKNEPPAVAFAGGKDFEDIKKRMEKIARFRPYKKKLCTSAAAAAGMACAAVLLLVHAHSYARYSENKDVSMVYQYDVGSGDAVVISYDTEKLNKMISYDDSYVYVDRENFEEFLRRNDAEGEIYIIFGGYSKLPGIGGAAESCLYECGSEGSTARISYESIRGTWEYIFCRFI